MASHGIQRYGICKGMGVVQMTYVGGRYDTHVQGEWVGSQRHDLECVMSFKGCLWVFEFMG